MARFGAFAATLLLLASLASAQSNCQGLDIFWIFSGSAATYLENTASIIYSNYGRNITMLCSNGAGGAVPSIGWMTSSTDFVNQCGSGAPLQANALTSALNYFNVNTPSSKRRVIVVGVSGVNDPIGNVVSVARQLKEATPPVEIYVVDELGTLMDLATGGVSNGLYGDYYFSTVSGVPYTTTSVQQVLAQKIMKAPESASGTCFGVGGLIGTFDGNYYNFPGFGEFWMLRTESDINVQIRTEACTTNPPSSTTCIRSVAIRSSPTSNGAAVFFEPSEGVMFFQTISSGGSVSQLNPSIGGTGSFSGFSWAYDAYYHPDSVDPIHRITFTRTSSAGQVIVHFGKNLPGQVQISLETGFGRTSGLCGTWDSCSANDFWANTQSYVPAGSAPDAIYYNFANTWRVVRDADSFWGLSPRTNRDYDRPLAPFNDPNFTPAIQQDVAAAAGTCSQYKAAGNFFEAACLYGETNGFSAVKSVVGAVIASECRTFCLTPTETPSSAINPGFCNQVCRRPTALVNGGVRFPYYNSTTLAPPVTIYNDQYNTRFQVWLSLGGTYTFELDNDWCSTFETATINVICDYTPSVDAGADRTVKKIRGGYPTVILRGSASDVNTNRLQYAWKWVDYPRAAVIPSERSDFKRVQGYSSPPAALTNDDTLVASFVPAYPGDYVIELKVFDGCSFSNDSVKITVLCEDCVLNAGAVAYPNDVPVGFSGISTSTLYPDLYNDYYSGISSRQWFLTSNSRGWTQRQVTSGSTRTYNLVYVPPEVITGSNQTQISVTSTSTVPSSQATLSGYYQNIQIVRNEGSGTSITYTNTTTTTFYEDIYYSSVPLDQQRCAVTISGYTGTPGVSFTDAYTPQVAADAFGRIGNRYCLGDYNSRVDYVADCAEGSAAAPFRVSCSATPRAHLVSCNKVFAFDYNTGVFPTITLDATDTTDEDDSNLWFAYEVVSQPAYSTLGSRILPSNVGSGNCPSTTDGLRAYQNCRRPNFTPNYGGAYTIRMRVTDTCTEDSEQTSFTINCDSLALNSIDGGSTFSDAANVSDYNRVTLNSTYTSAHPVTFLWNQVAGPVALSPASSTAQGVDFFVQRGGVYTVQLRVSDRCQYAFLNHTFTYSCSQAIVPSAAISGGNWNATTDSFDQATFDGTGSTYLSTQGRSTVRWNLISAPAGATGLPNVVFASVLNFVPTRPGVYNYSLFIDDDCQSSVSYWTLTAGGCPALPTVAVTITPSTQAWNYPVNASVPFTIASDPVVGYTKSVTVYTPSGSFFTSSGADSFDINVAQRGTWVVTVRITPLCEGVPTVLTNTTFQVTCGITMNVGGAPTATSMFVNGKFPRVSLTPTVTVSDSSVDLANYYGSGSWQWNFNNAPSDSVFYLVPDSTTTVVGNVTFVSSANYTSLGNGVWRSRYTYTQVTTVTRVVQTKYLNNNDAQNRFVGCFAPDRPGTYSLTFSLTDFCGNTLTTTGTVTATCNGAPTAAVTNSTINASWLQNGYKAIPLDGRPSSDPDNDALSYYWEILSYPLDGWSPDLGYSNRPQTVIWPYHTGQYIVRLTVTDGCSSSSTNVTINVVCDAGALEPVTTTYQHDGFTPVSVSHFVLRPNPTCPFEFDTIYLKNYVPAPYNQIAPPPAPEATGSASTISATLLAVFLALLVVLF